MAPSYRAAVIGGGMIGAQMDAVARTTHPQTHAGGYKNNLHFDLVAICDPIPGGHLKLWDCPVFPSLAELLTSVSPDVVSVAVPGEQQYGVLKQILKYECVKAVIVEKPLTADLEKAKDIVRAFEAARVPLLVNYTRRYSPMYQAMAIRFHQEEEEVISASIRYAKGLWHNGSHALDLALLLFGKVQRAQALTLTHDFHENDPSVSAFLSFEYCPIFFLQALDERHYTLFEVDIFTDQKRYVINMDHRNISIYKIEEGAGIPVGKRLVHAQTQHTDYCYCMSALMNNLHDVLQKKAEPLCTGQAALKSLELAHELNSLQT